MVPAPWVGERERSGASEKMRVPRGIGKRAKTPRPLGPAVRTSQSVLETREVIYAFVGVGVGVGGESTRCRVLGCHF